MSLGRVEYAVIPLRDDTYLEDIQETLGALFDIGVNQWGIAGALVGAFVASCLPMSAGVFLGLRRHLEAVLPPTKAACVVLRG